MTTRRGSFARRASALLALLATTAGAAGDFEFVTKETFEIAAPGTLEISTDLGDIHVTTNATRTLAVDVTRTVRAKTEAEAQEILDNFAMDFQRRGPDVVVDVHYKGPVASGLMSLVKRDPKVRIDVSLPPTLAPDLNSARGSIRVEGVAANVRAATTAGDIEIRRSRGGVLARGTAGNLRVFDTEGPLVLMGSSGNIEVRGSRGTVRASTSAGSITVQSATGALRASTASGNIEAELAGPLESDASLETSAGNVDVYLPAAAAIRLSARTGAGAVTCEMPVTGTVRANAVEGTVNGGGPGLTLRTSAGNIQILAGPMGKRPRRR